MKQRMCLDGKEYAADIKQRSHAIGRTVKSICLETKTSYRAYCSWVSGENNPSFAKLKPIYALLDKLERRAHAK